LIANRFLLVEDKPLLMPEPFAVLPGLGVLGGAILVGVMCFFGARMMSRPRAAA